MKYSSLSKERLIAEYHVFRNLLDNAVLRQDWTAVDRIQSDINLIKEEIKNRA